MRNAFLFCAILAVSGCTNLESVRNISADLMTASESWEAAGSEFHDSCLREYRFNLQIADCNDAEATSQGLAATTEVLHEYFETLALAANESSYSIEPGIRDLASSASGIEGISETQAGAVAGLANMLADLVLGARRERTLRDLIDNGGSDAQIVVDSLLKDHVAGLLRSRLQAEQTQLANFYDDAMAGAGLPVGIDPRTYCDDRLPRGAPALQIVVVRDFCDRRALVISREEALDDYVESLDQASEALAALQSNRTKLTAKELAQQLYSIGAGLRSSTRAVRAAFE